MNLVEYVKAVAATAMDANDNAFISDSRGDYARTIRIPVSAEIGGRKQKIGATDFGISDDFYDRPGRQYLRICSGTVDRRYHEEHYRTNKLRTVKERRAK